MMAIALRTSSLGYVVLNRLASRKSSRQHGSAGDVAHQEKYSMQGRQFVLLQHATNREIRE